MSDFVPITVKPKQTVVSAKAYRQLLDRYTSANHMIRTLENNVINERQGSDTLRNSIQGMLDWVAHESLRNVDNLDQAKCALQELFKRLYEGCYELGLPYRADPLAFQGIVELVVQALKKNREGIYERDTAIQRKDDRYYHTLEILKDIIKDDLDKGR